MNRLQKNKKASLLASRKKLTPQKKSCQEPSIRTRKILGLIPPDESEGPSSSSEEEDPGDVGLLNFDNEIDGLQIDFLNSNVEATLQDILSDIPTSNELFEQEPVLITIPADQEPFGDIDLPLLNVKDVLLGPSTSTDVRLDHNYTSNIQLISPSADVTNTSNISDCPNVAEVEDRPTEIELKNTSHDKKRKRNSDIPPQSLAVKKCKRVHTSFHWKKKQPFLGTVTETTWLDSNFKTNDSIQSPTEYFSKLFTNNIWDLMVAQTNLYSCQVTGSPINVNLSEMKGFIGILIMMGIVDMPAYTDYWSVDLRDDKIASVMPLKRFQSIRRYLHFTNNDLSEQDPDRYKKIRPLVDIVRQNFLEISEEGKYSIDEMVVPYKGKRAGNRRQYLKNKPKKWGFKIFVRSGVSGMIYDFLLYGGDEDTFRRYTFSEAEERIGSGAKVVLSLCKSIQQPNCSFVFFDNFFCSLELLVLLREKYGIFSLGTLRADRLRDCPLIPDKVLAKQGRGSFDMAVDNDYNVCVVKWEDNKSVCLASTFCEVEPVGKIKRFPKKSKGSAIGPRAKVDIPCPDIIKQYNCFMGGVDLADMLIALYRTPFRTHRWYMAIFSQVLDMCICNAWLLYKRDFKVCGTGKPLALKGFRRCIADNLIKTGKRYSSAAPKCSPRQVEVKKPRRVPEHEMRYDQLQHFPEMMDKGRCAFCKTGQTKVQCMKCKVRLCLTQEKNCFYLFHKKS
uniref:PiggyBac transposable element-derived protein domain-containing protein n=1 Tax=Graphocephala atropunctata TaxID=36148 RepID=A0A1B6LRI5_9HEMI